MRTDILQSLNGGGDLQPRRMDGMKSQSKTDRHTGFAKDNGSADKCASFRKVFDDVKAGNRSAEKTTRDSTRSSRPVNNSSKKSSAMDDDKNVVTTKISTLDTELSPDRLEKSSLLPLENENSDRDNGTIVDDERACSALEIVMEAFDELSNALGINLFNRTEQFSLSEIDSETKAQFAEVIYVLKKMMQGMELSNSEGLPVELPGKKVEGKEINMLTDTLRAASFKIEIACNVLGISESVQQEVAQKMEQFDAAGILQASNPQDLTMSPQHLKRLFGTMFTGEEPSKQSNELISHVKKMFADATGDKTEFNVQSKVTVVAEKLDPANFEAGVYRALLKIDAMHKVGTENEVAVEKKMGLPQKGDHTLLVANALEGSMKPEEVSGIIGNDGGKPAFEMAPGVSKALPAALTQMTEDSVVKQVAERLQSVVRAGLTEVRIQLRPESLGDIKMRIRMEGDVVFAKIEVANQQVKEIVERNFGALKDALAQHNISAGSFDVTVGSNNGRHNDQTQQDRWFEEEDTHRYKQEDHNNDEHKPADESYTLTTDTGRRFGGNSIEYFG